MNLPFPLGLVLAALSGFIALGYEIVWNRLFNFATGSRPEAFGGMLGSYLLGLALGSLWSRRWQHESSAASHAHLLMLARLVLISNLVGFLVVPAVSWLATCVPLQSVIGWVALVFGGGLLVMVAAALLGVTLPLLCHLAIAADTRAGARMSYLYLSNIIGSGLGSFVTGFLLMDWLRLWQIESLFLALAVVVGMALAWASAIPRRTDFVVSGCVLLLAICSPVLHRGVYERLQNKGSWRTEGPFAHVVESRHGVVTVDSRRVVCGNGAYDGIIDTGLERGSLLVRPYFVSAVHPAPRQMLVIGMSAGAWSQILAHHPQAEQVTVVEISRAYLDVIRAYPQVSSLLTDPKVEIVIDDGRRWLRRNPGRHFDAILMNTTLHYREFASALLSREFLTLARAHLNPGGIIMWNCTGSERAARTGTEVFPYTMMVCNNCVGSLAPLQIDKDRWRSVLSAYRYDGGPLFDLSTPSGRQSLEGVLSFIDNPGGTNGDWRLTDRVEMETKWGQSRVITDDNLGDEYGRALPRIFQSLFRHRPS